MIIVAANLALGLALWTVITFYLSWLLGFNPPAIILAAFLALIVSRATLAKLKVKTTFNWWMTLTVAFWAIWFGLIFNQMLRFEADGLYAGWINVWGDWAAHLSYAASFGLGDNFPPQMPLLAGSRFGYPFLADFFPAMLVKLGLGLVPSMLLSSWIWAALLVILVIEFGWLVSGKLKVGLLTAWLFLLGGGLGWWWWFKDFSLAREYTHLKLANIEWINLITSQIIPQRGFVMGFTLALLGYWFLWRKLWLPAAIIIIALPLIHAHSFVIVAAVAFWLMLKAKLNLKVWVWFWLIVIAGSLPQLIYFYGQSVGGTSFIRWQPGWMAYQGGDSLWWFWLKNLGLFWILIPIGAILIKPRLRHFSFPFWILFIMANLFIWQPWEWDNSKLITHWFLIACVLAAVALERGFNNKLWLVKLITLMALLATIGSGWLDNLHLSQYQERKIRLISASDLILADWVIKDTPADSLWLTADNHDHFLPVLTGRKAMLGFKGWLWTYGLNYSRQEAAVNTMWLGGEPARQQLEAYGVDFVIIGPAEKQLVPDLNHPWFKSNLTLVRQNENTVIYRFDKEGR